MDHIYYIAGQKVNGVVYLNVNKDRPYEKLMVTLVGEENIYWVQQKLKSDDMNKGSSQIFNLSNLQKVQTADPAITHKNSYKISYKNRYKNYQSSFIIRDFNGTIPKGQYSFPFCFFLPYMMAGSFVKGRNNYITYYLIADLIHVQTQDRNQSYCAPMNILEPPRMPNVQKKISKDIKVQGSCCLNVRPGVKNVEVLVKDVCKTNGQKVQIMYSYEQKQPLQLQIKLRQQRILISEQLKSKYQTDYIYDLGVYKVQPKSVINATIPQKIIQSTAIGSITALYYILAVNVKINGCFSNEQGKFQFHIFIQSRQPKVIQQNVIPPPKSWNPVLQPKLFYKEMKPFKQRITKKIPYLNVQYEKYNTDQSLISGYLPSFTRNHTNKSISDIEKIKSTKTMKQMTDKRRTDQSQNKISNTNQIPNLKQKSKSLQDIPDISDLPKNSLKKMKKPENTLNKNNKIQKDLSQVNDIPQTQRTLTKSKKNNQAVRSSSSKESNLEGQISQKEKAQTIMSGFLSKFIPNKKKINQLI